MRAAAGTEAPHSERVLIVRLTALGDVILVTHLARALRAAHPGVAVDLLTDARIVPLLERLAAFDRVIGWDRRGADAGLGGVLRVKRRLQTEGGAHHYVAVVDLQNKLRTRALTTILGADRRATLQKRGFVGTIRALLGRDRPIDDRHTLEMYAEAARAAGLDARPAALGAGEGRRLLGAVTADPSPQTDRAPPGTPPGPLGASARPPDRAPIPTIAPTEAAPAGAAAAPPSAIAASTPSAPKIGLGAGTTHATKRWPHFAALARELAATHPDASFFVIGGPSDRAELDAIRAVVPPEHLDPRDTAALDPVGLHDLLHELDLLVTVDSGASHLAQASGVPTLVLFGPTSPVRWGPRDATHRALSLALPCAPCSNTGSALCPRPDHSHACMRDLDATTVAHAARAILERSATPDEAPAP